MSKANLIPIQIVMKAFNVEVEHSGNQVCPFPHHDDSSPSWHLYDKTNSFTCWGCRAAGGPWFFAYYMLGKNEAKTIDFFKNKFNVSVATLSKALNGARQRIKAASTFEFTKAQREAIFDVYSSQFSRKIYSLVSIRLPFAKDMERESDLLDYTERFEFLRESFVDGSQTPEELKHSVDQFFADIDFRTSILYFHDVGGDGDDCFSCLRLLRPGCLEAS